MTTINARWAMQAAALSGLLAVIIGAFGAHALKAYLSEALMNVYNVGVSYQFYHTFALLAVGWLMSRHPESNSLKWSAFLFVVGLVLFSGSLYLLALSGVRWFGLITPVGGISFILAWFFLFWAIRCGMKDS